jgi:hypothetical protein
MQRVGGVGRWCGRRRRGGRKVGLAVDLNFGERERGDRGRVGVGVTAIGRAWVSAGEPKGMSAAQAAIPAAPFMVTHEVRGREVTDSELSNSAKSDAIEADSVVCSSKVENGTCC